MTSENEIANDREIIWTENEREITARFAGFRLRIEKLSNNGPNLSRDGKVVRLLPRRYKSFAHDIIANTKIPVRTDLELAKQDAIALAKRLRTQVETLKDRRKAELLRKLTVKDDS